MSGVDTTHPEYTAMLDCWSKCRDTYAGQEAIKARGNGMHYLPPTEGQVMDGLEHGGFGHKAYCSYLNRAIFHDVMADAVEIAIGLLWNKDAKYTLTPNLEYMLTKATTQGESLRELHLKLNVHQLVVGRQGMLLDLPASPTVKPQPYIAWYKAEDIRNWDSGRRQDLAYDVLNLVVLDESAQERQADFSWDIKTQYRVLVLGDVEANETEGVYRYGVFREDDGTLEFSTENLKTPKVNGKSVDRIPFVFVNSKDLVSCVDNPPLMGVANMALAIYRGEADYRQALYMTGQDTLVTIGVGDDNKKEPIRIGAGARINIPNPSGDAKFIGVDSSGLSEQRTALENLTMIAAQKAGQIIDTRSKQRESGEALKTRLAAQTSTLTQIALAGAKALEDILKIAAEWVGDDPSQVSVVANTDFSTQGIDAQEIKLFMQAKLLGAPVTYADIHALMVDKAFTKKTFEDLMAESVKDAETTNKLVYAFPVNEEPSPAKAPTVKKDPK